MLRQVLSVPFYAWDNTQSLQQRAAYLDCLLGSQSSHLATSQVGSRRCSFNGFRCKYGTLPCSYLAAGFEQV